MAEGFLLTVGCGWMGGCLSVQSAASPGCDICGLWPKQESHKHTPVVFLVGVKTETREQVQEQGA